VARHVLEFHCPAALISTTPTALVSTPGILFCEGYICRAACSMRLRPPPLGPFLECQQPGRRSGLRGPYQPPDLTDPDTGSHDAPGTPAFGPVNGLLLAGLNLSGPPVAAACHKPRAELLGSLCLLVGQAMAPVVDRRLGSASLGR